MPPAPSPVGAGGSSSTPASGAPTGEGDRGGEGLTLGQLIDLVERACRGERELGGRLFGLFQGLVGDAGQPAEMRRLADTLLHVLIGERQPDLAPLPPGLASAVRGLLGRLREESVQ